MEVETVVPDGAREMIVVALVLGVAAILVSLLANGRGKYLVLTLLGAVPRRPVREVTQPLPRAERDWELVGRLDTGSMRRRTLLGRLFAPVGRWIRALAATAVAPIRGRVSAALQSARESRAEAKSAQEAAKRELADAKAGDKPSATSKTNAEKSKADNVADSSSESKSDSQRDKAAASAAE